MPLILEGIVTTLDAQGVVNIAPMGPVVDRDITRLTLRPYQTSRTYSNLKHSGCGVFHVTDNVELLVRAAINRWADPPATFPCDDVPGVILEDACRWYAFRVRELDDRQERTRIECTVAASGRVRDFFGFNRAKHAVLEAAILATRIGILSDDEIREGVRRLGVVVEKTAGEQEQVAWTLLSDYFIEKMQYL